MKILCLFVRHGASKYPEALAVLDRWYAQQGLLDRRTLWIIDNALPPATAPRELAPAVVLRAGDNAAWEFSAWARALREIGPDAAAYDVVHFVTSAFNTLYTVYLDHFHPGMLGYLVAQQACLGHIDGYDRPVELAGRMSACWIRTCFFFLPLAVARDLGPWAAFAERARFFDSPDGTGFRPDASLSADYQRRIRVWLEGQEVGGHTWHSPINPGPDEARRFQLKTLAILNEHHLAITLRERRVPLVDFCWLHSWGDGAATPPPAPPAEAEQLKVRRRILGIPEPPG